MTTVWAVLLTGCGSQDDDVPPTAPATSASPASSVAAAPAAENPDVARYADQALNVLDAGLHASGERWEQARRHVQETALTARSPRDLDAALDNAVGVAGGKHSRFTPGMETETETGPGVGGAAMTLPRVTTEGGITVLSLPPLILEGADPGAVRYARTLADGIDAAAPETCGWVVDLQGNSGGNMWPMLSGVSALLPKGAALSFRDRAGEDTAVTVQADGAGTEGWTAVSVGDRERRAGAPIAVLQDRSTASSGEAILVAFRGVENVRSFGQSSAGLASANGVHVLSDGSRIVLTAAEFVDRTGRVFGDRRVDPDVNVHFNPVSSPDAAMSARAWLREQGCP